MTDLVENVANMIWREVWNPAKDPKQDPLARAAIAAVLDELMEPTEKTDEWLASYGKHLNAMHGIPPDAPTGKERMFEIWRAMLDEKRRELGLSRSAEPIGASVTPSDFYRRTDG